ncbi:MAG: nitroreductase family protein [Patescibacteria group bacterium]
MKETIKKILEYAVYAPSGDNSQPWRFVVKGNKIFQYNLPFEDNIYLNYQQSGSYVSHGAVIENIFIASSHFGYATNVELFPENSEQDLVAILDLQEANISIDPEFECIKSRCVNRRPYDSREIGKELLESIKASIKKEFDFQGLSFITDRGSIKEVGVAATVMERIALRNPVIHKLFFSGIIWTDKEHRQKKKGLYIKTLELPLPVQYLFRLFKHWPVMSFLGRIGFPEKAANGNAEINAKSAAFGIITTKQSSPKDFILAGRVMQRIWLKTTSLGLSLQPVTGLLFLAHRVKDNQTEGLSLIQTEMIKDGISVIEKKFSLKDEIPIMMFRIGYAKKPTANSFRMEPKVIFKE